MPSYHVIMADIVKSSSLDPAWLGESFSRLVSRCNESCGDDILSPLTITLGDEFQGVAASLQGAVATILSLEETLLAEKFPFRLRYVVVYGEIGTELNRSVAHGMMGSGLTLARQLLTLKQRSRPQFQFDLDDAALTRALNRYFRLVELLTKEWKGKDCSLVLEFIRAQSNSELALRLNKDRSLLWKRRKSLRIEEYLILRELIQDAVKTVTEGS